ncbi:MAG: carbohydrate ABC transporter permease [Caulobacteraceae bacterium]
MQQYYIIALYKGEYFKFFMNSVIITISIIAGQVFIGIFAAYAFAKMNFRGSNILFFIYIIAVLLPFQVTLVPNYLLFDMSRRILDINLLDTHMAIILPGVFSSFGVFLLKQFIKGVPDEMIESARIDGASYIRILIQVIFPVIKPAIYSLIVLTFIDNWNLLEQAVVFLDTPSKLPLSVYLENIYHDDNKVFYAGSVLYIIPALFVFLKGEKYLRDGFVTGGLLDDK